MEQKYFKVEIPKGFCIDEENSTFEKIVFKPIENYIRWNSGVEIKEDDEHFIIRPLKYNIAMDWDDAMDYCKSSQCILPSKVQLLIMYKHKEEINKLFKEHGYKELKHVFYWSCEQYRTSGAWYVYFGTGGVHGNSKSNTYYVRPVANL